jgi:alpha-1,3-mannosyltransferase
LGVSVKMNVLLFAPGLLFLMWSERGFAGIWGPGLFAGAIQVALAWPFVTAAPLDYVKRAFDFGRQFQYIWSVNWKFVPEGVACADGGPGRV